MRPVAGSRLSRGLKLASFALAKGATGSAALSEHARISFRSHSPGYGGFRGARIMHSGRGDVLPTFEWVAEARRGLASSASAGFGGGGGAWSCSRLLPALPGAACRITTTASTTTTNTTTTTTSSC